MVDDGDATSVCPMCHGAGKMHRLPLGPQLVSYACRVMGMPRARLLGRQRTRDVSSIRQVLMMLMRDQGYATKQIAGWLGRADHTTVIHGSRRAEYMVDLGEQPWTSVLDRLIEGLE